MKLSSFKNTAIYSIYTKSFCDSNADGVGDFGGIIWKLDYLKSLGVGSIMLTSIFRSKGFDDGKDVVDFCEVQKELGAIEDFDRLVSAAHIRGMRVILEIPFNHTSINHYWFTSSAKSKTSLYRDYYIWNEYSNDAQSYYTKSAWEYCSHSGEYYLHQYSKEQADLNLDNERVQKELVSILIFWLERGVDGFKFDSLSSYFKSKSMLKSGKNAKEQLCHKSLHKLLARLRDEVFLKYPAITIADINAKNLKDLESYLKNGELSMLLPRQLMLPNEQISLLDFKSTILKWQQYFEGVGNIALEFSGSFTTRLDSRLASIETIDAKKALAAINILLPGTPVIYYGEEIGLCSAAFKTLEEFKENSTKNAPLIKNVEPQQQLSILNRYSHETALSPMQWGEGKNAEFSQKKSYRKVNQNYIECNVAKQETDKNSLLNFYKELLKLRKKHEPLYGGTLHIISCQCKEVFSFKRVYQSKEITVVINLSPEPQIYKNTDKKQHKALLHSKEKPVLNEPQITLKPFEVLVLALA